MPERETELDRMEAAGDTRGVLTCAITLVENLGASYHRDIDALLVRALRAVANDTPHLEQVERLIAAYESLDFHYG